MSGPLSLITETLARLSRSRAEAKSRAQIRRLGEGLVFTGIKHRPELRAFGNFEAAREVLNGRLRIDGYSAPLSDLTPWDADLPSERLAHRLHGFAWLDDLEALSGKSARAKAQGWLLGWLDRYGDGGGPGWAPALAAARLRRLLTHLPFLERNLPPEALARLQASLPLHMAYINETWEEEGALPGRVRALTGVVTGAICLNGAGSQLAPAHQALAETCASRITAEGTVASRNPEALLWVFRDLLDVVALMSEVEQVPKPEIPAAIARIAPVLRGLRHGDGRLACFHGGGPSEDGLLDRCLAESRIRTRPGASPTMGYSRLSGGRVDVIVDTARPPERSDQGHASTLAFEMSSGRRRVIVNAGPALPHDPDTWRWSRATAAHSTLSLDRVSSSRLGPAKLAGKPGMDALQTRPSGVTLARASDETGSWIQTRHDGYLESYGLIHERRVFIGTSGHQVHGEDVLLAPDDKSTRRFAARIKGASKLGVLVEVHFHLHQDVNAELDRAKDQVRLTLASGEVWLFRHHGGQLDLEATQILDPPAEKPIPSRQILLRDRITEARADLSWSLILESIPARARRDVGIDARRG